MLDIIREFPKRLSSVEASAVIAFIIAVYMGFLMCGLHTLLSSVVKLEDKARVWSSEGGLWDHPEPNYAVLPFVAEFFATATAIPLAGGFLLYQALRFSYNTPVLILYLFDCWMYTCAFFSHMLLWPLLNSITLTSVLSNALYTFSVYSGISGSFLSKWQVRVPISLMLWTIIVYLVVVLPPWFGENGGVPALLVIQTPAVICACTGAVYCYRMTQEPQCRFAFRLLTVSGFLLCSAMAVSLIEVLYGKQFQSFYFGKVPAFHIVIHLLEQAGIYLYGVGVAIIDHTVFRPVEVGHPKIDLLWGCIPYLAITVVEERKRKGRLSDEFIDVRRSPRLAKEKAV